MPSLLLVVFVLQLIVHIVNSVGAAAVNELLWTLYNKLPISSTSSTVAKATALRREVIRLKRELNATSAQDDFAKWAKLRRQFDKATADHDKLAQSLQSTRSAFDSRVGTARWLLTSVLRLFLQYWYARTAMFWIPKGWVPYYAEWILSWPRAPIGSVSIQMWFIACGSVISIVGEAVGAAFALLMEALQKNRLQRAKAKVAAEKKTT
ncbi:hypothetical protein, variant [Verruconis gallopava]|uniref:Uncharacterized protein n=1 Tax=Verruconis gallopava TaxID=253628 RepID=A0A0D2AFX2_9PEZI|nr:uncharacterized protein PV09_03913 [Verruconis gallopava]XP_016215269.1 hypothetical protein, variant [Verruconis gallopava]KIW05399.1 hypothetical protein PV09_03913 [Verruconis gallopava]KIW05400.1 hypothetical protein, variant [Verruconis gallopava]